MSSEQEKVSVRDQARIRRKNVMDSPEFHKWWENRREIQPTPSDPYRAFMIDRSLHARHYDEVSWQDYVNRSDYPPVDNRAGYTDTGEPIHRRHRRPSFVPKTKQRKDYSKQKYHKSMQGFKEDFVQTYNLPDVDIVVERRGGMAYMRPNPVTGQRGKLLVDEKYYEATRKSKKKSEKQQFFASVGHELGHHGQYAYGYSADTKPRNEGLGKIYEASQQKTQTLTSEKFAWNVAKDYVEKKTPKRLPKWRGMAKVREKWAFGTYEGTEPPSMRGPNPKFVYQGSTNLLVKNKNRPNVSMFSNPKISITGVSESKPKRRKRSKKR